MLFWVGSSFVGWGQITLSTSTIWDNSNPPPLGYEAGIEIMQNTDLHINGLTLYFDDNSEIILALEESNLTLSGCTLVMGENSIIKLDNYCKNKLSIYGTVITSYEKIWQGIKGVGNFHGPSFPCNNIGPQVYTTPPSIGSGGNCDESEWLGVLNPNMSLITINNSLITNAISGVQVDWFQFLRVRDTEFRNCENGVRIGTHPAFNSDVHPSYIMACDFIWDDNLLFSDNNLKHIILGDLLGQPYGYGPNGPKGVRIGGCNFLNERTNQSSFDNRGVGIFARSATFSVSRDGSKCCSDDGKCPDNCYPAPKQNRGNTFEKLGIGIDYADDNQYNTHRISVRFSEFDNCVFGIKIKDNTSKHSISRIGDNTFIIDKNTIETYFPTNYTSGNVIKLVHFEGTADFGVYDNTFSHNLEYIACITSKDPNLEYTNFIRKNTFTSSIAVAANCGPNVIAIDLYGNNNHLDITCNTFVNHVYDVKVNYEAELDDIPNLDVHNGNGKKFSNNTWSILPGPNGFQPHGTWKSIGCSGNVYIEDVIYGHINIYDRYSHGQNIRFYADNYDNNINQPHLSPNDYKSPRCNGTIDEECVDCSTDCDKLVNEPRQITVGMEKLQKRIYFELFPNPSFDKTQIIISQEYFRSDNKIVIYDFLGKVVAQYHNIGSTFEFNLKNHQISKGIYFVSYQTEGIISVKKLVVQ